MSLMLISDIVRMFTGTPTDDYTSFVFNFTVCVAGILFIFELIGFMKLYSKLLLMKLLKLA